MNNYSPEVSGTALPAQAASLCVPASGSPVHAWRVMEWQPESVYSAEQAACFSEILPDVFSLAGRCFHVFSSGRDRCFILLAHTTYAAPVHCDLTAWLCGPASVPPMIVWFLKQWIPCSIFRQSVTDRW